MYPHLALAPVQTRNGYIGKIRGEQTLDRAFLICKKMGRNIYNKLTRMRNPDYGRTLDPVPEKFILQSTSYLARM